MVEVKVYSEIGQNKQDLLYLMLSGQKMLFDAEGVKNLFDFNKTEKDFKFNIHSDGGSTEEGFVIYDILRTSGKNIYMNIEGSCHSMATCLLLAAPLENRSANKNATALIHRVRGVMRGVLTSDELIDAAYSTDQEERRIADLYADRTKLTVDEALSLMQEEKEHSADELLALGFISKINSYNTNQKNVKEMAVKKEAPKTIGAKVDAFLAKVNKRYATVNYDFTDDEGNVLFSTDKEDDSLVVGDVVTLPEGATDGEFTLPDGRKVTIVNNEVTAIEEPASEVEMENAQLKEDLAQAVELINALRAQVGSSYKAPTRVVTTKNVATSTTTTKKQTPAEMKAEADAKRKLFNQKNK